MDGFLWKRTIKINSRKGRNVTEYVHRSNFSVSDLHFRRNRALLYLQSPENRWENSQLININNPISKPDQE